jgi:surfactin synthase thioesterase subunit
LSDYIDHGIPQTSADGTRTLAFDRRTEYLIYRTLPHTFGTRLAHGSPVPISFIAGTKSKEMRQVGMAATQRLAGERLEWIEGSHLYPMERPIETARAVQRMLYAMENGS